VQEYNININTEYNYIPVPCMQSLYWISRKPNIHSYVICLCCPFHISLNSIRS